MSRGMSEDILATWNHLQDDPEKSIKAQAVKEPKWFYEFVRPLLPRELFITGDINLNTLTPAQIQEEIGKILSNRPDLVEVVEAISTTRQDR